MDPTRMCELLVGLPEVNVLGVLDETGAALRVYIETREPRPVCACCGRPALVKDRPQVELVDLAVFGRQALLVWRKHRWACAHATCSVGSWTGEHPAIAAPRLGITDRAGRWATEQVGRHGRTVNEVAVELGCDWHTINDTVIAYGTPLVEDPDRIGEVTALGLDETLFARIGRWRIQHWSTSIVDVATPRLLDVVPGRDAAEPCRWLAGRGEDWCARIQWATLDLSGPYRLVFNTMVPDAVQVADPFHLVKVRHEAPCLRGRVRDPPRWAVAAAW
jgi:transposase